MNFFEMIKSIIPTRIASKRVFCDPPGRGDGLVFPCGMSRSGTTLLTTVLDSHSRISLAYELIPPPSLDLSGLLAFVRECESDGVQSIDEGGQQLKERGQRAEGIFLKHCHRAGLSVSQTRVAFSELCEKGLTQIHSLAERLMVAETLAGVKHREQASQLYGFKLNTPSVADAYNLFPHSYFIYIVRDPRDVMASHIKRNFNRSTEQVCKAWNNYLKKFEAFSNDHPERSLIVRYEDLVTQPAEVVSRIFDLLPVAIEEAVFKFYESNASVHGSHHPNAQQLQQDFFTSSIGRWRGELDEKTSLKIQRLCREGMMRHQYTLNGS